MLEMGLTVGTECTVVRYAPLGDPMEIRVRGYSLSLRAAEAAGISVSLQD
ncbi:MAG TPA: FeoA family protein [Opitutaceae bacterium]|nr:FeoA family protein [Opitutaceae bacterium]